MTLEIISSLFGKTFRRKSVMPLFSGANKRRDSLAKQPDVCRIAVLGDAQTGKTSLVRQFLEFKFPQKYRPTVDDIIQISYKANETLTYEIELVDATGSFEFPAMRKLYVDTSDAFIVVMSVDSEQSVEEAHRILQLIRNRRTSVNRNGNDFLGAPMVPARHLSLQSELSMARQQATQNTGQEPPRVVFVLNKMDLVAEKRTVNVTTIQYDKDFGFENVVLTSAKENWNVDEAFSRLIGHREQTDSVHMDKSLEAALQHRRVTAPAIDLTGASDNFLRALKNSMTPGNRSGSYAPIAP